MTSVHVLTAIDQNFLLNSKGETFITLYNVCSVHRGVFSTLEGYHEYIGGGGSVHRRDTMSTSEGYHEYIGGCSVHRGIS